VKLKTLVLIIILSLAFAVPAFGQSWTIWDSQRGYRGTVTKTPSGSYSVWDSEKGYTQRITPSWDGRSYNLWDSQKGYQGTITPSYILNDNSMLREFLNDPAGEE